MKEEAEVSQNQSLLRVKDMKLWDGVGISTNKYGKCLIATKNFKKGDILTYSQHVMIPGEIQKYIFTLNGETSIGDSVQSVKYENQRAVFSTCFMNHSCDFNTQFQYANNVVSLSSNAIATKDIQAGEQLSCNYLCFDYECDGHQFECQCDSEKCFKQIRGFKNLSLEDKLKILPQTDIFIQGVWLRDQKNVKLVLDLQIPQGCQLKQTQKSFKLFSKKAFNKDEIILKCKPMQLKEGDILIYKINDEKFDQWKSKNTDKVQKEFFFYAASLANQSEQGNCRITYQKQNQTGLLSALKQIHQGEQLIVNTKLSNLQQPNKNKQKQVKKEE